MNIRKAENKCQECRHFEICNLKDNLSTLRKTTHDLGNLMENQKFNIVVYCDYYDKKLVER